MAEALIDISGIKVVGEASCVGGKHPDPPLDNFPLLVWCPNHAAHGDKVFTEDGKASVEDIAMAAAETQNMEAIAERFGTTYEHVRHAVEYAIAASFLGKE